MMTTVERTTNFEAAAAEVWDALTDEALLGEWFDGDVSVDLRPGGSLRVTSERGVREAVIDDVGAPTHLSFTWSSNDGVPTSKVDVDLEPWEHGCRLRVRETLIEATAFPIGFRPPRASAQRRGGALALARS
jgi:uncharacterized protein YndB with AHSA1/START domain